MAVSRRNVAQGLGLALSGIAGEARAYASASTDSAFAQIDREVETYLKGGWGPGASVAVMRGGTVILSKSYGMANLETGAPVTAETVFRAGSITKQFTAAAIVLLAKEGRLNVDDALAKYIPELAAAGPVTLRMALNHTSGIHTYTDVPFQTQVRLAHTSKQMVDYIAAQKTVSDFGPGTRWRYSNSNFYLLGVVVERVSGLSLRDFLAKRVFSRANLVAAALDQEADVVPHRASGYVPIAGQVGRFRNADFISLDPPGGAGALRSTSLELARWHQALFAGRVVNSQSLAEMITPGRLSNDTLAMRDNAPVTQTPQGYGYGLEVGALDGEPSIGHGGGIPGFASYLVTFPRLDLTVATMTNGEPSGHEPLLQIAKAALGVGRA